MDEFLSFVAEIMEVEPSELSADTEYGVFPQWDSVIHLQLVMEIEEKYGVEIPFYKVPEIRTLAEFYSYIEG